MVSNQHQYQLALTNLNTPTLGLQSVCMNWSFSYQPTICQYEKLSPYLRYKSEGCTLTEAKSTKKHLALANMWEISHYQHNEGSVYSWRLAELMATRI